MLNTNFDEIRKIIARVQNDRAIDNIHRNKMYYVLKQITAYEMELNDSHLQNDKAARVILEQIDTIEQLENEIKGLREAASGDSK